MMFKPLKAVICLLIVDTSLDDIVPLISFVILVSFLMDLLDFFVAERFAESIIDVT